MLGFLKKLLSGNDNTEEIKEALKNGAIILDARTPMEYKSGHINKAINSPVQTISNDLKKLKKQNKVVVAYCRSGARSASAVATMKNAGINAINAGSMGNLQKIMQS